MGFSAYSFEHAIGVVTGALFIILFVVWGKVAKGRNPAAEEHVRWTWIALLVIVQGGTQIWSNLPGRIELGRTVPLHICDLAPWIGILALMGRARWPRALAYFWGIGLSIWAFIFPILPASPWSLEYWLFWVGHAQIIGTAIYLIVVLEFRPRGADLWIAALATLGYAVVITPIDIWLAADYGYLGQSSAVAELGPWPVRIATLLLLETVIFVVLMTPWWLGGLIGGKEQPGTADGG
jgi:hypothetical integral membrane protein (TIGR02206 family)